MADVKQQVRDYIVENFLFGDTSTEFSDADSFMEKGILDSTGILEVSKAQRHKVQCFILRIKLLIIRSITLHLSSNSEYISCVI